MVRFRYKDYAHGNRNRTMTLKAIEFVRRLLLHVLPTGFVRIRHYGVLSNRHRHQKLELCRRLLGSSKATEAESPEDTEEPRESPSSITPTRVCPVCGAERMIMIRESPPMQAEQEVHKDAGLMVGFDKFVTRSEGRSHLWSPQNNRCQRRSGCSLLRAGKTDQTYLNRNVAIDCGSSVRTEHQCGSVSEGLQGR